MKCECFSIIETKLREKTGDPRAKIKTATVFNENGIEEVPTIPLIYRKKKNDGTFCKKVEETSVTYSYCPWCGKKMQ